jgi:hypothetical protein
LFIGVKGILEPLIENRARDYVETTDSEYYIYDFEDLKLNVFKGWIRVLGVEAKPGQHAFDSLRAGVYDDLDQIVASNIYISVNYFAYLRNKTVEIDEIRIVDPDITIFHSSQSTENVNDPIAIKDIFSDDFQGFTLKSLSFENAKLALQNIEKERTNLQLGKLDVELRNVILNQQTLDSTSAGFIFDRIQISTDDLKIAANDYYDLEVKKINVTIEKDELGVIHGSDVDVSGINYSPTDLAIQEIKNSRIQNLTEVSSEKVTLKQFKVSEWLSGNKLVIGEFIIESPAVKSYVNTKMNKTSQKNPSKFVIEKIFKEINIGKFHLSKGQVVLSDIHQSAPELNLEEVDINFENLLLDSTTKVQPFGFSFTNGTLTSKSANSDLGEYYSMSIGQVLLDFKSEDASIANVKLTPKQTHEEYSKIIPYEMDQYTISIGAIHLNKLSFADLSDNLGVKLQSAIVSKIDFNVYRDKWVDDQEFVYKPLPSHAIRNLPFPLWIDTLRIEQSNVTYQQLGDVVEYDGEIAGEVTFSNLNAQALRVTNDPSALAKNPYLQLDANATFMGDATLYAQYKFNIPDTMDTHYVTATMENFHTSSLDPMVKNLLLVEIPDGIIHKIDLNLVGNDTLMTGTMEMEYENLNVNVLKSKNPKKSSGFLNTVANGVIRKNNKKDKGKFVVGIVSFDRYQNKSVFNYSWNGVKSGLISTAVPFAKNEKVKTKKKRHSK